MKDALMMGPPNHACNQERIRPCRAHRCGSATTELTRRDPTLAGLIAAFSPLNYPPRNADGPFGALVRSIVHQQLALSAAQAILGRVIREVGGTLTPEAIAGTSDEKLRAAGLSRAKLASLRDLTEKILDGTVALNGRTRRSDEEVISDLTQVRGIGRWTAEVYLMFELRRLDVWPVGDLGLRHGYAKAWTLDPVPTPKELLALGEHYRPYRSIVAWYCWRAAAPGG
jgi:DNA-3-methyladenine glycosylase II